MDIVISSSKEALTHQQKILKNCKKTGKKNISLKEIKTLNLEIKEAIHKSIKQTEAIIENSMLAESDASACGCEEGITINQYIIETAKMSEGTLQSAFNLCEEIRSLNKKETIQEKSKQIEQYTKEVYDKIQLIVEQSEASTLSCGNY